MENLRIRDAEEKKKRLAEEVALKAVKDQELKDAVAKAKVRLVHVLFTWIF